MRGLTVDGNGHALAQDVAISALERGDLAELVQLAVVVADALGRLGVDLLELDVVGLGDSVDGRGAGVALLGDSSQLSRVLEAKQSARCAKGEGRFLLIREAQTEEEMVVGHHSSIFRLRFRLRCRKKRWYSRGKSRSCRTAPWYRVDGVYRQYSRVVRLRWLEDAKGGM